MHLKTLITKVTGDNYSGCNKRKACSKFERERYEQIGFVVWSMELIGVIKSEN